MSIKVNDLRNEYLKSRNRYQRDNDRYGVIAQLVERLLSMQEALGSTPSNSIFFISYSLLFFFFIRQATHNYHLPFKKRPKLNIEIIIQAYNLKLQINDSLSANEPHYLYVINQI